VVELKREARSNAQGIVHLENIPEGSYDLFVRRLGYRPFVGSLEFHAGDSIEVAIVLQPLQLLDTVHVTGHVALTPQLRQFRIRERKGFGHFLDDSLLARKRDVSLITVLTTQLPGLARLWDIGESGNRLVSLRGIDSLGPPQPCFVTIFLDDTPVPDIDLAMVHPNELAGVEYYTDADIPAQYRTLGARCGVLLLWSKPPRR
jgi:hypothetical protein